MGESQKSGIVLLAKRPGRTSFSSLGIIKKALGTKKVGHTGTLDSFAEGLLVVCVGSLTRLASIITSFDKTYEAIIEFGKETDTLDPTGNVIRQAELPEYSLLLKSLEKISGKIMQAPPAFSALHVDGKRASDLMRKGVSVELEKRPVEVFSHKILDVEFEDGSALSGCEEDFSKKVKYAKIQFHVSKGTYIRSLARDIGTDCKSAAYLIGLLRTQVSMFTLDKAAGCGLLEEFTIRNAVARYENAGGKSDCANAEGSMESLADCGKGCGTDCDKDCGIQDGDVRAQDEALKAEICQKMQGMSPRLSLECGLIPVKLLPEYEYDFFHGRPLKKKMLLPLVSVAESESELYNINGAVKYAVFLSDMDFAGAVLLEGGRLKYSYVIPHSEIAGKKAGGDNK